MTRLRTSILPTFCLLTCAVFDSLLPLCYGFVGFSQRVKNTKRLRIVDHSIQCSRSHSLQAASTPASYDGSIQENAQEGHLNRTSVEEEDNLAMPWSKVQDWALRDQLPKYTVMIPLEKGGVETYMVFALWRTLLREVVELSGYPIDFLQKMHKSPSTGSDENKSLVKTPELLPFLDEYQFEPSGGISGRIYGVPGLADGTRIETSPISNLQVTLPQGFVRTMDGSAAYELGKPNREDCLSLDDGIVSSGTILQSVTSDTSSKVKSLSKATISSQNEQDVDTMLVRLGASTGILLAGALAVNMLSHHLTVNVFWV